MEFWKPENATKTDQSTAMRFNIHKAQTLMRILEILSALILIFWSTTRLPIALKRLTDLAKQTFALLLTTPSVFLIGNAIVATLVAQFKSLTNSSPDIYDELVIESRNRSPIPIPIQTQEIKKVDSVETLHDSSPSEASKCCRRTQSERVVTVSCDEVMHKELMRTRTGNGNGEMKKTKAKTAAFEFVDELSGDEFRLRVEAFIAKQQRFIRDENMPLVVSN